MLLSGFTFIRNGVTFDYPFRESLQSMLPLVDELIVAVGNSEDGTREAVTALGSDKIRILDTTWDESLRSEGRILAQQTNLALAETKNPWCLYLQGDEVLHEEDFRLIHNALDRYADVHTIKGLLFNYIHFYGSYGTIGESRRWYRREIRVVRNHCGIESWGDAQGFRMGAEKLRVAHVPARVFHYGWVKPPTVQRRKLEAFHKLWHDDAWVEAELGSNIEYRYEDGGRLRPFEETHPAVMRNRVSAANWEFNPVSSNSNIPFKDRMLDAVEDLTGWRIGEYRNYIIEDTYDNQA